MGKVEARAMKNRIGNQGLRLQVKVALRASKSIARHGRATPALKAARASLREAMRSYDQGGLPNGAAKAALSAHGQALKAMGLPGLPSQNPVRP